MSQVVFGDAAFVIITNMGNDAGSLDGMWLRQGSSAVALPYLRLRPGEQALLGLGSQLPPDLAGMTAVVPLGTALGPIAMAGGELALYRDDSFEDPASLIGYVAWGTGPHPLAEQATAAGLWEGPTVEIVEDTPSISTGIYPATRAEDWAVDIGG